jgi:hypothetical protein
MFSWAFSPYRKRKHRAHGRCPRLTPIDSYSLKPMAKKILIVDDGSHMKKTAVEALVRRLVMRWVIPGVSATRAKIAQFKEALPAPVHIPEFAYIPEKLPPYELPGLTFKESEQSLRNRESSQVARYRWFGRDQRQAWQQA